MIIYGVYNSDTLEQLMETVHRMHNTTSWSERTFAGKLNQWFGSVFTDQDGIGHYAINSILFLTMIREKYVRMYERFLEQLENVCSSDMNSFKRLFANFCFYHHPH